MNLTKKIFFSLTFALLLTAALPASAQGLLPACAKDVNAVLQLSCFITLLIGVSQWILGITGSLALLFFVYGGFFVFNLRRQERPSHKRQNNFDPGDDRYYNYIWSLPCDKLFGSQRFESKIYH